MGSWVWGCGTGVWVSVRSEVWDMDLWVSVEFGGVGVLVPVMFWGVDGCSWGCGMGG